MNMQTQLLRKIIEVVLEVLERKETKIIFLITTSCQDEALLLEKLQEMIGWYPKSVICMDEDAKEQYPNIAKSPLIAGRLIGTKAEISENLPAADKVAAVTFAPAVLTETALGMTNNLSSFTLMEALLEAKPVLAAEDDFRNRLQKANKSYRRIFYDAKRKTELFGISYCSLESMKERLQKEEPDDSDRQNHIGSGESRQLVTVETLAKDRDLLIEKDAIITPAAKEILRQRQYKNREG